MMEFKGVLIPELKCKYLTLELHLKKFNLYGVAGLLRASSHVEILNIDTANTAADNSLCHFELSYLAKGDNIDFESWIPIFVFPNLKKVKLVISFNEFLMVRGDWGMCLKDHCKWGFDKLFRLSEFLLRAATVLEKFIIISKTVKCKACSTDCISPFLSRLSEKL
ncbi:uncharacterized protein LOC132624906 [Lycium barbarum]|uniref:uncharacterized protein LOC132624906 n=1 Tax=Lycium barbarum TaxID=112863 RepID=UPI00293EC8A0|nr:uncharacterized protein LOC132624906 [Lycium barbarum]